MNIMKGVAENCKGGPRYANRRGQRCLRFILLVKWNGLNVVFKTVRAWKADAGALPLHWLMCGAAATETADRGRRYESEEYTNHTPYRNHHGKWQCFWMWKSTLPAGKRSLNRLWIASSMLKWNSFDYNHGPYWKSQAIPYYFTTTLKYHFSGGFRDNRMGFE